MDERPPTLHPFSHTSIFDIVRCSTFERTTLGACRRIPTSARERAIFSPGKDDEAGDVGFIVDAAGCSQVEKGPLEARSGFPTEPSTKPKHRRR